MSARAALKPLTGLYGVSFIEGAPGLRFVSRGGEAHTVLTLDDLVDDTPGPIRETTPDALGAPVDVRLHFIDRAKDFQVGMVSAQDRLSESVHVIDVSVPIVMGPAQAGIFADSLLARAQSSQAVAEFGLSPARLDIEVGDILTLPNLPGQWQVEAVDERDAIRVSARAVSMNGVSAVSGFTPGSLPAVPWVTKPEVIVLDIPEAGGEGTRQGVLVGAQTAPFNPVTVTGPDAEAVFSAPAIIGALITPLPRGPVGRWDFANVCDIAMAGIDLSAIDDLALLSGENRFAVETETGWEILQARDIELIDVERFRFRTFLRGLAGTDADMVDVIPAGARIAYLGQGFADLPISNARIGEDITLTAEAAGRTSDPLTFTYAARHLRPLSPVHGKAEMIDGNLHLSWVRRTRIGGDSWAGLDVPLGEESEMYRVEFWEGETITEVTETPKPYVTVSTEALSTIGSFDMMSVRQSSILFGAGVPIYLAL